MKKALGDESWIPSDVKKEQSSENDFDEELDSDEEFLDFEMKELLPDLEPFESDCNYEFFGDDDNLFGGEISDLDDDEEKEKEKIEKKEDNKEEKNHTNIIKTKKRKRKIRTKKKNQSGYNEDELQICFQMLDRKKKGYLTKADLFFGFFGIGDKMTKRKLKMLMLPFEKDTINLEEFMEVMEDFRLYNFGKDDQHSSIKTPPDFSNYWYAKRIQKFPNKKF